MIKTILSIAIFLGATAQASARCPLYEATASAILAYDDCKADQEERERVLNNQVMELEEEVARLRRNKDLGY